MRTPPDGPSEDDLVQLLAEAWRFRVADLRYAPVGFGSHHWVATDASGDRRFVTLDDFDEGGLESASARFAGLRKALLTARALRDLAQLSFVVAPLLAVDGSVLCSLGPRRAVAVFPFVVGRPYPSTDDTTVQDRAAVVEVLAQLHDSAPTALASAGVDDLELSGRAELDQALDRLREPWAGGPFAEETRALLASSAAGLRALLRDYDRLSGVARARGPGWVVTHGEPKADNLLVTSSGLRLVDWDTALVAPAARDLWMVDAGSGAELALYTDLTGRRVTPDELTLYRLRWELSDIAAFVRWFALPHERTPDTEIGWRALSQAVERVRQRSPDA